MREILAFIMLVSLLAMLYVLLAGVLYGSSPYGLHPVVAGAAATFAALCGYAAAAFLEKIE